MVLAVSKMKSVCRSHALTRTRTHARSSPHIQKQQRQEANAEAQKACMAANGIGWCGKTTAAQYSTKRHYKKRFSYHFHYDRRKLFRIYINENN